MIKWLLELEATPFTMNDNYFRDTRSKIHAHLRDERTPKNSLPEKGEPGWNGSSAQYNISIALQHLAAAGFTGVGEEDLKRLRKPDTHDEELEVMAETRAYFQIAFKVCPFLHCLQVIPADDFLQRVIDYLPRVIDASFLQPLPGLLHNALISELHIAHEDGLAQCRRYLAESPLAAAQRDELVQKRNRLESAKDAIRKFGIGI